MDISQEEEMLAVAPSGATEVSLIEESVWGAVRGLREQGVSKREIGRRLDLDIKTVRKWLRQKWEPQRRPDRGRGLDSWEKVLRERAPEVGFNAAVLYRELKSQGYEGSYPSLVRYLRPWREEQCSAETSTVRFETGPGEQAQVDWGSAWVWLGEERVRVHVFTMVLGYSRRIFARGYREEGLVSLLDGHAQAFEHFGGCTQTILYDNPRTIVLAKDESSGWVEWNTKFKDRMDFYGVTVRLCRYYRAQTKGKVESGVKYVKHNALAGRRFGELEELNAWLLQWCLEVADQRVHGTTHELPAQRFAQSEAAALNAVDARPPAPQERMESRIVPRDGLVAVEANRYPVPLSWAGHTVRVHLLAEEILFGCDGEETVRHSRLLGKHQVARWNGPPRNSSVTGTATQTGPPRFDPTYLARTGDVERRSLDQYAGVAP
jgi:transposase